ncbi:X-Pro aminopeptidase [Litorivita pollutaquae]|uniref:X-Pro aminopeptidase n=1 Tax=Litorivita pollutaquae TaxID=2200892 RepID=A0A2V4N1A7_9RHOB|nr:aminopeptidase P family protein [Litorivita pollutaquae]PYC48584.1 X-Pro aminopeptidase [Litorivita pollutaquae]
MYQSFDSPARPEQGPPRLAALRAAMTRAGLAGFVIPRSDAHQGEYVAPRDDRLAWLTGFTGSAGFCAALQNAAGVFIDGRYREQVRDQVDLTAFTPVHWPETGLADWLIASCPEGGNIGFDPWLHTRAEIARATEALDGTGISLGPCENLVDQIWPDQPGPPMGKISTYPEALAGESSSDKRARLGAELAAAGHASAVITLPDSIAWLLNIRGADIPRNPVPHAFAILHANGHLTLFCADEKITPEVITHLGAEITIRPPQSFLPALRSLTAPVRLDRASAPVAVEQALTEAGVAHVWGSDPCVLPKASKTSAEIAATVEAHLRDGAAVCEFLAWYDAQDPQGLTEIDLVKALEQKRRDTHALRDISFDTICGTGPNGAVIHYRVTEATNRPLKRGDLVVLDSGGQYEDGTTDITRTLPVGSAEDIGAEEKSAFTRVLKGMIAISRARFPKGLKGRDLDALARAPLWAAGQDYDHGTGHGVGVYLCVHEGPQRLSRAGDVTLRPGMILSNEPGYYRPGAFGIRIENLIVVREAAPLAGGDAHREMYDFDTLTFVPIDRRLIALDLLDKGEIAWIDAYHAACRDKIGSRLSGKAALWLAGATEPLG